MCITLNTCGPISKIKNDVAEFYQYRNILFSLVHRDLFGHYKNSFLGFIWHFISPLIMLLVYFIVYYSGIISIPIDNFVVYISCVLFPFNFMLSNLTGGAGYIIGDGDLLKKIYFPREITVLAHVISSFIIMILGYVAVFIVIGSCGFVLNPVSLVFTLVILVLMFFFVLGFTLFFSALTVYVKDIQFFLQSASIVFIFVTPMFFSVKYISGFASDVVWMNPFTYFIEAIHDCIYYKVIPSAEITIMCLILTAVSLVIGLIAFKKLKHGFIERL